LARFRGILVIALTAAAGAAAGGAPTGLNVIPTTDLVPYHSMILQLQNGNTSFRTPAFYDGPDLVYQSQFALTPKVEAGVDVVGVPGHDLSDVVLNLKESMQNENDWRPNMAIGVENVTNHQAPVYYLTLSKTLNYAQEQYERFRAHHRRNRKLLGRRIHAGLTLGARGAVEPFLGTDLQLNDNAVFQADWIDGPGNAVTAGLAYVLRDQRTVLNPALLFSNNTHRVDGFFLNIGHQFNL
jgi:hypothetical protein